MKQKYLSVLVENNAGVLARVSALFCRRGFNIDSLTVSATDDETVSRITITVSGDDAAFKQIIRQTEKLCEVKAIFELEADSSLLRELLLIKVAADESNRRTIKDIADIYKAKTVDLSKESMVMELTGEPSKIDGFLAIIEGEYKILEMCRTGATALARGPVTYKIK